MLLKTSVTLSTTGASMPKSGKNLKSDEIAALLKKEILAGRMSPGARIKSVRRLSAEYGITPYAADKALDILEKENIVQRFKGSGSYLTRRKRFGFVFDPDIDKPDYFLNKKEFEAICEVFERHSILLEKIDLLRFSHSRNMFFNGFDGILASSPDGDILKTLFENCRGKIVLYRNLPADPFPFSQVSTDLAPALHEFSSKYDLLRYDLFVVLNVANNKRSRNCSAAIWNMLVEKGVRQDKVEQVLLNTSTYTAPYVTYNHFSGNMMRYRNRKILVFAISEYFFDGIKKAFKEEKVQPDILSFDNLEKYKNVPVRKAWHTAIDLETIRCAREAAELLIRMVNENDDRKYIIRVPAKFIDRKSVRA